MADAQKALNQLIDGSLRNYSTLLPLFFSLRGKPLSLKNYFPFEPMFNTHLAENFILCCGRQTSKSTSQAERSIALCATIPFFNVLTVAPQFETVRRYSTNYVKAFIDQSPIRALFQSSGTTANVLQRSFPNYSTMHFSYAYSDADRVRGLNTDMNCYDEIQDMNESFFPIIRETMGGSRFKGISVFTGTPKTTENVIQQLFDDSSAAEWLISCPNCKYDNIAALRYDLDAMTGPSHADISEETPGLLCARARCRKPLNPRWGRWWHERPDAVMTFPGYHVPQQIMPMHCCDVDKWRQLCAKREGKFNTPINVYYNEICGESYNQGARLISETELKEAAQGLHKNDFDIARRSLINNRYITRALAVDWGGGGIKGDSLTACAVLGLRSDGKIDVIYGHRSLTPHDRDGEAQLVLKLLGAFRCEYLIHDYCGAGSYREEAVIKAGWPMERTLPVWYMRAATQHLMKYVPETESHWRSHYKLDKPRSLSLTCQLIKHGQIRFFDYDKTAETGGLINDFLALVEDKVDTRMGREIYTIIKAANKSDDFAQAVNMGVCGLYFKTGRWPNVAASSKFEIDTVTAGWFSQLDTDIVDEGWNNA